MSNDLISRKALKEAIRKRLGISSLKYLTEQEKVIVDEIDNASTVEPDMEFAKWVTKMIFDANEVEDFDFELFSELACRKLEALGLVTKTESEWTKNE